MGNFDKKVLTKLNVEVDEYGGILPVKIQERRIKCYRELVISCNPECPFIMPALGSGKKEREANKREKSFNEA